ncbi:MAG: ParB/RepB/Spo0J family partition protein [Armatimonadetes bacterium]|nr:ParB/RepB/Spo0J family partition protein [Armatimonadota bacterium]
MEVQTIPVDKIIEDPDQPRQEYDEQLLLGLADSIRRHGLLNPITVRPLHSVDMFQIVTGERRWRAAQSAGLTQIPCIVKEIDPAEIAAEQLIENLQREDLSPLEKARGLAALKTSQGLATTDIANMLGLSERSVRNALSILELPEEISEQVISSQGRPASGALTESHARSLRDLNETPELQRGLANKIRKEGLTSAQAESLVRSMTQSPELAQELLAEPIGKAAVRPAITGPAVHIQSFARYLDLLEVDSLHPGHLASLKSALSELSEIIANKREEIDSLSSDPL